MYLFWKPKEWLKIIGGLHKQWHDITIAILNRAVTLSLIVVNEMY